MHVRNRHILTCYSGTWDTTGLEFLRASLSLIWAARRLYHLSESIRRGLSREKSPPGYALFTTAGVRGINWRIDSRLPGNLDGPAFWLPHYIAGVGRMEYSFSLFLFHMYSFPIPYEWEWMMGCVDGKPAMYLELTRCLCKYY